MIRRDWPLGGERAQRWLLIRQTDHAELSAAIARDWRGLEFPSDAVRDEFLAAVRHHDDGWADWDAEPRVDPETGRPYSFTEMPPEDSQRIWSDSIAACRRIGPLAGWVVASHFYVLQDRRDEDFPEWTDWLAVVDAERSGWLAEWREMSPDHTPELAERCLAWLRAFDWISLWLCCVCPDRPFAAGAEPLVVGDDATGWPATRFTPTGEGIEHPTDPGVAPLVEVSPWPFAGDSFGYRLRASEIEAERLTSDTIRLDTGARRSIAWELRGDGSRKAQVVI